MIEPGYYNTIYNQAGEKQKNVVSWHGHFLVGVLPSINSRSTWIK
jgi:hypothetical protein